MTYAFNGVGAFNKTDFSIPVFLYMGIDKYKSQFTEDFARQPGVTTLPNDVNLASQLIDVFMQKRLYDKT